MFFIYTSVSGGLVVFGGTLWSLILSNCEGDRIGLHNVALGVLDCKNYEYDGLCCWVVFSVIFVKDVLFYCKWYKTNFINITLFYLISTYKLLGLENSN